MKKSIERIDWVDVLKFLGIFAIYLGHFADSAGKFYPFVFEYHVALFFFVSGFFLKYKKEERYIEFAIKKFKRLMIPYFSLTFLYLIIYSSQNNFDVSAVLPFIKNIFLGVRNTLVVGSAWFIPCLFIALLMFDGFMRIFKGNKLGVLFCSIVCFLISMYLFPVIGISIPSLFWNIDSAFYYIIYVALGNVFYSCIEKFDFEKLSNQLKYLYINFNIFSILFTIAVYFKGSNYFINFLHISNSLGLTILYVVKTLIMIYANVLLAKSLVHIPVLSKIGKDTLYLCGIEGLWKITVFSIMASIGLYVNFEGPLYAISCTAILIFSASYTIIPFLKKYFSKLIGEN